MSEVIKARPVSVSILSLLLIALGVLGIVRSVWNVVDGPAAVMWPLLAGSLLTSLIVNVLNILAGLLMLGGRRGGWILAGVVLFASLIGGLVGTLQQLLVQVNGEPLYSLGPTWVLYYNLIFIVVDFCLLLVLYSQSVRLWLNVQVPSIPRSLAGLFALGLLLQMAQLGIMALAGWLNSLVL